MASSRPASEPTIVIERREELVYMICEAAEMEHALMCEYLFAAFSLKVQVDGGLTADQLAAVERWRNVILGVAGQEMLHLALTANMLTALGASPHLSRPNLPQPARHYPPGVRLALLPFGEQALRHFMYLERPEGMQLDDADGLGVFDDALPLMSEDDIAPRLQDFRTVGHLYRGIEQGFAHLAERMGEERLFVGPPEAQVRPGTFQWSKLVAVTDLASAIRAIEEIVEQGEGPRGDWHDAHFGRFKGVFDEFLKMRGDDPYFEPAHPVIAARVRAGDGGAAGPFITDQVTARVADLFNVCYEVLLLLLYRLLSRIDETDEQMGVLADVGVGLMFEAVAPIAKALSTLPIGDDMPGLTAGAPFELFYQPDYLLPHRRAAWLVISERIGEAAAFAGTLSVNLPALSPVAAALSAYSERMASGV